MDKNGVCDYDQLVQTLDQAYIEQESMFESKVKRMSTIDFRSFITGQDKGALK